MSGPVVIDTSVLIAGLLAQRGAGQLVTAFFDNRLRLAFTSAVLSEYAEVLERPEFSGVITPQDRIALILKLHTAGLRVQPAPVPEAKWPDPDDVPFVAAALALEEKILVTLNPRDFAPAIGMGVRVLSPSEAKLQLL